MEHRWDVREVRERERRKDDGRGEGRVGREVGGRRKVLHCYIGKLRKGKEREGGACLSWEGKGREFVRLKKRN